MRREAVDKGQLSIGYIRTEDNRIVVIKEIEDAGNVGAWLASFIKNEELKGVDPVIFLDNKPIFEYVEWRMEGWGVYPAWDIFYNSLK